MDLKENTVKKTRPEIFICYAHQDEALLDGLEKQLTPLRRQGLIDIWHSRHINAGTDWKREIGTHLMNAKIILLLISPDFMASDYCYGTEMKWAIERHERQEACVIPIILRPIDWQIAPLNKLQALPKDAKPISEWRTREKALQNVAQGIRDVVEGLTIQNNTLTFIKPMEEKSPMPQPIEYKRPNIPHFKAGEEIEGIVISLTDELRRIVPSDTMACLRYKWYTLKDLLMVVSSEEAEEWGIGQIHRCFFAGEDVFRDCTILHCYAQPGDRGSPTTRNGQLINAREQQGWSIEELAKQIGITSRVLVGWEAGTIRPAGYSIRQLCRVFGKSVEELGFDEYSTNDRWKYGNYDMSRDGYGHGECSKECPT